MTSPNAKAVAIVSGGMDSVTLAFLLKDRGYDLEILSVDYGQRHSRELDFAARCADRLGASWHLADLKGITHLLAGSALTDDVDVPEGHYADETMKATVVPNRNAILLSVATALAVSSGARTVATGVHAGDHPIYPDCRPAFVKSYELTAAIGNEGFIDPDFRILAPFVNVPKDEICRIGTKLGVPYEETWSCYQGGEKHCGRCGTCVERREAFELAGVEDPTEYE